MSRSMSTEAATVTSLCHEVEVIAASDDSLEHESPWFWLLFEWTIGQLLAWHIERKSLRVVLQAIHDPEAFIEDNSSASHILDKARNGFGRHRLAELFELRTRFFNASSPLMQHFCTNVAMAAALDDVYNAIGSFSWNGQRIYPLSAPPDAWSNFSRAAASSEYLTSMSLRVGNKTRSRFVADLIDM